MFFLICQVFNFINFLKIFMPLKISYAFQNRIAPFLETNQKNRISTTLSKKIVDIGVGIRECRKRDKKYFKKRLL